MIQTLIALALAGGPAGAAPGQAADPGVILDRVAEAIVSTVNVRYEAEAELASARSRRLVRGTVCMSRFQYNDPVGGLLSIRGEIDGRAGERTFQVAYDGETVLRLRPEAHTLLRGDLHYGGSALLAGSSDVLVIGQMLAAQPFGDARRAGTLTYGGEETVGGIRCEVVEIEHGGDRERWSFGADDHLPRRYERHYESARGSEITSVLTVSRIEPGVAFESGEFTIEPAEGVEVEQVGRRPPPALKVGDIPPDFTLTDGDGVTHTLSEYRGKVVLLEFWSTTCHYCQESMPALERLKDDYGRRGFQLLAINCRDLPDAEPVAFVRDAGYDYTVLLDGSPMAREYSVRGIPALFVLDTEGRLVYLGSGFGAQTEGHLRTIIEGLLP